MSLIRKLSQSPRANRRSPSARRARLEVESLESRVVLYSASGNFWPSAQVVTISFMPDGTNIGGRSSNLMAAFNAKFGSAADLAERHPQGGPGLGAADQHQLRRRPRQRRRRRHGELPAGGPGLRRHPDRRLQLRQLHAGLGVHAAVGQQLLRRRRLPLQHRPGLQHQQRSTTCSPWRRTSSATRWACTTAPSPARRCTRSTTGSRTRWRPTTSTASAASTAAPGRRTATTPSASNGTTATATDITSLIDATALTALVSGPRHHHDGRPGLLQVRGPGRPERHDHHRRREPGPEPALAAGDDLQRRGDQPRDRLFDRLWRHAEPERRRPHGGADVLRQGRRRGCHGVRDRGLRPDAELRDGRVAHRPPAGHAAPQREPDPGRGGQAIKVAQETLVNTYTAGAQETSDASPGSVAMDGDGNYVVTWASKGQDGDGWGVYAQRFDASGDEARGRVPRQLRHRRGPGRRLGGDERPRRVRRRLVEQGPGRRRLGGLRAAVRRLGGEAAGASSASTPPPGTTRRDPSVAIDASGNFVVTWSSNGQDGRKSWGVYAQRFDASGREQGGEFRVNSTTDGRPAILLGGDGQGRELLHHLVEQPGRQYGLGHLRAPVPGGRKGPGEEIRIETSSYKDQSHSTVAVDSYGHAVVVWSGHGTADKSGVFMQRFDLTHTDLADGISDCFEPEGHDHDHDHDARGQQSRAHFAEPDLDLISDVASAVGSRGARRNRVRLPDRPGSPWWRARRRLEGHR